MSEEELFAQWFERQRRESFDLVPDYGTFEQHPHWGIAARNDMHKAWMARATLETAAKPQAPWPVYIPCPIWICSQCGGANSVILSACHGCGGVTGTQAKTKGEQRG